jgi:hypothetical protein
MSDHFTDQLSAYLDGELDDLRRARLDAHLATCPECSAVLADLRAIVAAAPEYVGREPEADLWPGIEARLETDARTQGRKDASSNDGTVFPLRPRAVASLRRFSLGQLLAASLVMAALGGGTVWLAMRGTRAVSSPSPVVAVMPSAAPGAPRTADPDTAQSPRVPSYRPSVVPSFRPSVAPVRFADADYDRAVRDLERVLESGRGRLDSTTVATIEQSLRRIDAAIAEARAAIQRDPANAYLSRQIASNMRRKLDLLRVAVNAINART